MAANSSSLLHTCWLFIASDLKTVVPIFVYALSIARRQNDSADWVFSLQASARIMIWLLLHLLFFAVRNQNRPSAIKEDELNKPWRPLPARRISSKDASSLGQIASGLCLASSLIMGGGIIESVVFAILTACYNESVVGDSHWLPRNLINAGGIATFAAGATAVALQQQLSTQLLSPEILIIAAVVATTVHSHDMHDQEGDAAAGRQTAPIYFGDRPVRWSLFAAIMAWNCFFVYTSRDSPMALTATVLLGVITSLRTVNLKTVKEDKMSTKFYCGWLVSIYVLLSQG